MTFIRKTSLGSNFFKQQSIYPPSLLKDSFRKVSLLYHQHRFSSSCEKDPSTCKIKLYKYKIENPINYDVKELSISEKLSEENHDFIASHIGLTDERDKNLIKTAMTSDIQCNMFEFRLMKEPEILYGIHITGNRNIVFKDRINDCPIPEKKELKLAITVNNFFYQMNYLSNYKKLCNHENVDPTMVVFFNSIDIHTFIECSTNFFYLRKIEKLT